jgi:hypothetical protein
MKELRKEGTLSCNRKQRQVDLCRSRLLAGERCAYALWLLRKRRHRLAVIVQARVIVLRSRKTQDSVPTSPELLGIRNIVSRLFRHHHFPDCKNVDPHPAELGLRLPPAAFSASCRAISTVVCKRRAPNKLPKHSCYSILTTRLVVVLSFFMLRPPRRERRAIPGGISTHESLTVPQRKKMTAKGRPIHFVVCST